MRIAPGQHTRYRRFIILSHPRTGSTLLHTYLNSHLNIYSYGELFHDEVQDRMDSGTVLVSDYYSGRMHRPLPGIIKAVGFKFFYQYLDSAWGRELLSVLIADNDILVIHLKRRDAFRTALSYALARATGHWTYSSKERPVKLAEPEVRSIMERQAAMEKKFSASFSGHAVLEVYYEDLNDNPSFELKRIQEFLKVHVRMLRSILPRQHSGDMKEFVSNYDELIHLRDEQ